jgi:hypothetical protein
MAAADGDGGRRRGRGRWVTAREGAMVVEGGGAEDDRQRGAGAEHAWPEMAVTGACTGGRADGGYRRRRVTMKAK